MSNYKLHPFYLLQALHYHTHASIQPTRSPSASQCLEYKHANTHTHTHRHLHIHIHTTTLSLSVSRGVGCEGGRQAEGRNNDRGQDPSCVVIYSIMLFW